MKNIIYGAGVVTVLTTLVFILLGKVDLATGVMIDTAILGLLYGIVQRIEKDVISEEASLLSLELEYQVKVKNDVIQEVNALQFNARSFDREKTELENKLKAATEILPVLKELVEDSIKEPVKKVRVKKVKVDKK